MTFLPDKITKFDDSVEAAEYLDSLSQFDFRIAKDRRDDYPRLLTPLDSIGKAFDGDSALLSSGTRQDLHEASSVVSMAWFKVSEDPEKAARLLELEQEYKNHRNHGFTVRDFGIHGRRLSGQLGMGIVDYDVCNDMLGRGEALSAVVAVATVGLARVVRHKLVKQKAKSAAGQLKSHKEEWRNILPYGDAVFATIESDDGKVHHYDTDAVKGLVDTIIHHGVVNPDIMHRQLHPILSRMASISANVIEISSRMHTLNTSVQYFEGGESGAIFEDELNKLEQERTSLLDSYQPHIEGLVELIKMLNIRHIEVKNAELQKKYSDAFDKLSSLHEHFLNHEQYSVIKDLCDFAFAQVLANYQAGQIKESTVPALVRDIRREIGIISEYILTSSQSNDARQKLLESVYQLRPVATATS